MTHLIKLGTFSVDENLPFHRYKEYMSYPLWSIIQQMITSTRAYLEGLEAGFFLLKYTEKHRKRLCKEDFEKNIIQIAYLILKMFDKLDMWEEYLGTWNTFRKIEFRPMTYARDVLSYHGDRIKPFILGERGNTAYIHFLYVTSGRRNLIEKKLENKKAGRMVGNQLHGKKSDLSRQELKRRLEGIFRMAEEAQHHEDIWSDV